ncbi:hypothetical protein TNCV_1887841 [Trichonephila clavipes]|nr:hypothetical protein TNCV_1887841 [Trichonephila clavipes]
MQVCKRQALARPTQQPSQSLVDSSRSNQYYSSTGLVGDGMPVRSKHIVKYGKVAGKGNMSNFNSNCLCIEVPPMCSKSDLHGHPTIPHALTTDAGPV